MAVDPEEAIYGAPIAFWSGRYADVPNTAGFTGRSAVWGFAPVYFKPAQVKQALEVILFDEWKLTPTGPRTISAGSGS